VQAWDPAIRVGRIVTPMQMTPLPVLTSRDVGGIEAESTELYFSKPRSG
jgi:hypothetical protein